MLLVCLLQAPDLLSNTSSTLQLRPPAAHAPIQQQPNPIIKPEPSSGQQLHALASDSGPTAPQSLHAAAAAGRAGGGGGGVQLQPHQGAAAAADVAVNAEMRTRQDSPPSLTNDSRGLSTDAAVTSRDQAAAVADRPATAVAQDPHVLTVVAGRHVSTLATTHSEGPGSNTADGATACKKLADICAAAQSVLSDMEACIEGVRSEVDQQPPSAVTGCTSAATVQETMLLHSGSPGSSTADGAAAYDKLADVCAAARAVLTDTEVCTPGVPSEDQQAPSAVTGCTSAVT